MSTCDWHIDGGTVKCGKPAVRGKTKGAHLCEEHLSEYYKRWGPKAEPGYALRMGMLESGKRKEKS